MKKLLIILAIIFYAQPAQAANTWYWSASGSGSTCGISTRCHFDQIYNKLAPGDHVKMAPGAYSSDLDKIACNSDGFPLKNGTAAAHIYIDAETEGGSWLDGQHSRIPLHLEGCSYWEFTGFDVGNSNADAIAINPGSTFNTFNRMIAFNGDEFSNSQVWSFYGASGNILNDCAGFGGGRKILQFFGGSQDNVANRFFAVWNNSSADIAPGGSPKETITMVYNSTHNFCNNCVATRDELVPPDERDRFGITSMDRMVYDSCIVNSGYFGSIAYVKSSQSVAGTTVANNAIGLIFGGTSIDHFVFENATVYVQGHTDLKPIEGQGYQANYGNTCPPITTGGNRIFRHITQIQTAGGLASDIDTSSPNGWTVTDYHSGNSESAIYPGTETLWVNAGNRGATNCYQYTGYGQITSIPNWPMVMDQRIFDRMTAEGRFVPIHVNADLQSLFGNYDPKCVNGSTTVQTVHYVSPTGTDTGSCTTATPATARCRTVTYMLSKGVGGDKFMLADGTYNEGSLNPPLGTSTNPTIVQADNRNAATIQPNGPGQSAAFLLLSSFVTLDGIDIDCSALPVNCAGIRTSGNPSNITIQNGSIRNTGSDGTGGIGSGIVTGGGGGWIISNNDFTNTGHANNADHAIEMAGVSMDVNGNRISGVPGPGETISVYDTSQTVTGDKIRNNSMTSGGGAAILLGQSIDGIQIYNNNILSHKMALEIYNGLFTNALIANNDFVGNTTACVTDDVASVGGYSMAGSRFVNNICYLNGINLIDVSGATGTLPIPTQNITGGIDPGFVSPPGDLNLATGSSSVKNGADLSASFTTDFSGATRTAPWDIGSMIYNPANPSNNNVPTQLFTCTAGTNITGCNDGTSWAANWLSTGTGNFTSATAPAGVCGGVAQALRSQSVTATAEYRRAMTGWSRGVLSFCMLSTTATPNQSMGPFMTSAGAAKFGVEFDPTGAIVIYAGDGATPVTGSITANHWYQVDINIDPASHPNSFRISIDKAAYGAWHTNIGSSVSSYDGFGIEDLSTNAGHSFYLANIHAGTSGSIIFAKNASPVGGKVGMRQITYRR